MEREDYDVGMKPAMKYKIYVLLFLIGTFPTYIFTVLNMFGVSQFPKVREEVGSRATFISSPASAQQMAPVIRVVLSSNGSIIEEAPLEYVNIYEIQTTASAVVVLSRGFSENKS